MPLVNQLIKILCCMGLTISVMSCVRVQIQPEEIVSDTVAAGKSLYQTVKQRRDGTEERLYTHSLPLTEDDELVDVAKECQDFLKATAENASDNEMEILEENTEVVTGDEGAGDKLICRLRAVI